ncbi:ABC transporter ATP-binding/permease [Caballeronia terrestris]|uniref:ABC transporter ATP-binding/permease n=1 Tax=Caballeronia terrestris TaxID=1226301 RepID=A0A158KMY0_9BURK|nr:ABC transporter ATP-binding/permease [Caballeronia terrestris]
MPGALGARLRGAGDGGGRDTGVASDLQIPDLPGLRRRQPGAHRHIDRYFLALFVVSLVLAGATPVAQAEAAEPLPARGDCIRLDNVGFSYLSRPGAAALSGISLNVRPGEHVALVGPSGAGKTTLFQLLLRFYDPQAGSILINGVPTRDVPLAELRPDIGVVMQESVIFSGSLLDNIRYGTPEATLAQVQRAAEMAATTDFIEELPQCYDTFLGERRVRLFGGQHQRIAIARAILKNPSILLLDEATSALDAASERLVQRALDNAAQNRATLVIAHRLATVQQADRIVVLEQGRIVAQDRHAELLQSSPLYAKVAALQFGEPLKQACAHADPSG